MMKSIILLSALVALGSAYPQLRDSYGLPVVQTPNQYDTPQVIIPSTSYGAPIAPSPTYGVPSNYPVPIAKIPIRNTYSFSIPKQVPVVSPTYGVPSNDVPAAPVPIYGVPAPAPSPIYGVPVVNDVPAAPAVPAAPSQVYGPPPTTAAPLAEPAVVYGPPPVPAQVYGPPPTPTTTTTTPKPVTVPAVVYGPPAEVYGPPAVPADTYGPPADTYGPPAVPAQVHGVPTEQVRAPNTPLAPQFASNTASSSGTPPAPAGVHSASSGTFGPVFVPHSVVPLPGVVQPSPAMFISPPRQPEDRNEDGVFCV